MSESNATTNVASARTDIDQFIPWVPDFNAKEFQTLQVKVGQNNSFEVYAIRDQKDDKLDIFFVSIKWFQRARIILNLNEAHILEWFVFVKVALKMSMTCL